MAASPESLTGIPGQLSHLGQDVYIAKRIINEKSSRRGVTVYRVKWLGYPHSKNTWEPEENLIHKSLLEKWKEIQARKKPKKKKKKAARGKWQNKKLPPTVTLNVEEVDKEPMDVEAVQAVPSEHSGTSGMENQTVRPPQNSIPTDIFTTVVHCNGVAITFNQLPLHLVPRRS